MNLFRRRAATLEARVDALEDLIQSCHRKISEIRDGIGIVPFTSVAAWCRELEERIHVLTEELGVELERAPRFRAVPNKEAK